MPFLKILREMLDCVQADRSALLYGCYQAKRFGGRYIFLAPSGLAFCASPITEDVAMSEASIILGPFLMSDHDEYLELDVSTHHPVNTNVFDFIAEGIHAVPYRTPAQVRSVSELLYACALSYTDMKTIQPQIPMQTDMFPMTYSIHKESELLAAISAGDTHKAGALLNDILGHILFCPGLSMEALRLRVFELTVLLSRAALKGGANIDAIFGLNYSYLREIDALRSPEDAVLWLHNVTRRFAQHVFDFADSKHVDTLHNAISFIKNNYEKKLTLQDVADFVYLNVTYFSKVFKDETGQTPGNFITATRIDAAKKLLSNTLTNIADIPELTGFESQSYFTRVFKKTEGCTPAQYRRMNQSASTIHKGEMV
jgi:AraC-like DNA-binding protein